MKEFEGANIREVWDFRLSTAVPHIVRVPGGNWVVEIHSKVDGGKPLKTHDTGLPTEKGDLWDKTKIIPCFEWLYSVRDEYALGNIEELKPIVKTINEANAKLAEMGAA